MAQNGRCGVDIAVVSVPYYSQGRFGTALTGGGGAVATYTIAAGTELQFFGYGRGQDMAPAGRAGVAATNADTNLQSAGETIGGQQVRLKGLQIELMSNTFAAEMAALLFPEASVKLSLDGGSTNLDLGLMHFWPSAGGLHGAQQSNIGVQPLGGGRPIWWFPSNGFPGVMNYGRMPEGLTWMQKGQPDSNLRILIRAERAVAFTTQLADEAAAAGVRGYANPAAAAVFVQLCVATGGSLVSSGRSGVR